MGESTGIAEKLSAFGIKVRHYRPGNQKLKCPQCSHTRKNQHDTPLSLDIETDGFVFNCHHCHFKGGSGSSVRGEGHKPRTDKQSWLAEFNKKYRW